MGWRWGPVDLNRVNAWIETGRNLAALLFIPCLCVYAVLMTLLIWKGGWSTASEAQRLSYFGITLIGIIFLIGIGTLWLQRRDLPNIRIQGPGGMSAEISDGGHEDAGGEAPKDV